MNLSTKIYSFRARIALILILTLLVTTAVLYRLNHVAEQTIIQEVNQQKHDLADAINIAQQSLSSSQWLRDFLKDRRAQDRHDTHVHVKGILVVNAQDEIEDSSDANDIKKHFRDLGFGEMTQNNDLDITSNNQSDKLSTSTTPQIFKFPVQTSTGTVNLVIVFAAENLNEELQASSRYRLLVTGSVLLFSILISLALILEFTHPVGRLIEAAKKVAEGDLTVYLPVKRRDELGRLIAVFNDMVKGLGERRELEARLYRSEQSAIVGRLASGIAHEIKNPLNYMSLTIDYLRSKYAPLEENAKIQFCEKMDAIKDEIKGLDRLVRSFLTYGRPLKLNFKPLAVREMISNILALASEQAKQQSIEFMLDQETDIPLIEADMEQLKSCFSNLILNAQHAMPTGGKINITFRNNYDGIEVSINDTGTGIAPENIKQIFEPYFSTKDTGTGLGLALVKRIVESHSGNIKVESKTGIGTTFCISLPYHPVAATENMTDGLSVARMAPLQT